MIKNIIFYSKILREKLFNFTNFQQNTIRNYFVNNSDYLNNIKVIYDIGAFKGQWTKDMTKVFKKSKFYLFEANNNNNNYLKKVDCNFYNVLLSDNIEEKNFFSLNATGDSYLKQKKGYERSQVINMMSQTLDNFTQINNLPNPDFIKIDTQGSELDVLKGANLIIKNCKFILLECPITHYNENAPGLNEYLNYMDKINYRPAELVEKQIVNNELAQIDILFKKKND